MTYARRSPNYLTFLWLQKLGHPYTRQHTARLEAQGKFPRRVKIGEGPFGRVVWRTAEILAWWRSKRAAPLPKHSDVDHAAASVGAGTVRRGGAKRRNGRVERTGA